MFTDNQKALAMFAFLLLALGCAGNGDYEYRKHQESKTNAQQMCK